MSRRVPAILILAQYLLATVAGGLFHDHGGRHGAPAGCQGYAPCEANRGPVASCDNHQGQKEPHHAAAVGPRAVDARPHGPCPVCQFLSKKPIPAAQVVEPAIARLREQSAPVKPILRPQPRFRTHLSRAPPAFA